MSRILRRLDDFRPLYDQVMTAAGDDPVVQLYRGTELVNCWIEGCPCGWIIVAPRDVDSDMEMVDESWIYFKGRMYCPNHRAEVP